MTFPTPNFSLDLGGQVALVTGASSGLGLRFAKVLAKCGARVVVTARRLDRLEALAAEIAADGGEALPLALDVADPAQIRAVVARASEAFGPIQILINNAGVYHEIPAMDLTDQQIDESFDINLKGPWILSCEVARRLAARGLPGRIVNITSMGAFGCNGYTLYSTMKSAMGRMTEVLAWEWGALDINVNAIAPGPFESEMRDAMIEARGVDPRPRLTRKRFCDAAMLDSTLLYLVSPASEAVTGTHIKVDDAAIGR